jgi:hypothetical protein
MSTKNIGRFLRRDRNCLAVLPLEDKVRRTVDVITMSARSQVS